MLKLLGISREAEPQLPNDQLEPNYQLKRGKSVFQAQAGIPSTADGLAYDPVQRLLAVRTSHPRMCSLCLLSTLHVTSNCLLLLQVSTSDGRIKVLGQERVEGLLVSAVTDHQPTKQLLFVPNRGGLIRLDQVSWAGLTTTSGGLGLTAPCRKLLCYLASLAGFGES
jgi:hypothetical protein